MPPPPPFMIQSVEPNLPPGETTSEVMARSIVEGRLKGAEVTTRRGGGRQGEDSWERPSEALRSDSELCF